MNRPPSPQPLACWHCGKVSPDVRWQTVRIGGQGDTQGYYCLDRRTCWARWNKKNIEEEVKKHA